MFGAAPSRTHMPTAETAVFRKWARRSLFALAILAAPAAYSEVASTVTDSPEPGTLLGNYLSGRVARGDHDTAAAADFYSRALAEDPKQRADPRAGLPARDRGGRLGSRHRARPRAGQGRAVAPHRAIPARLRRFQAGRLQGSRRAFLRGAPRPDCRSDLDPGARLGAAGRRQDRPGARHPRYA